MTSSGTAGDASGAALELLTRRDCAGTPAMHARLLIAVGRLGAPLRCVLIDLAALEADDVRRGYATPTVLVNGHDLFGMEAPTPAAAPAPT